MSPTAFWTGWSATMRGHDIDVAFIKADSLLRKLRGHPRYEALLRKMNLPVG